MRRLAWLPLLLLAACRPAPLPLVGVLVSGPGRLARVAGLEEGLKAYPERARFQVCQAATKAGLAACARRLEAAGATALVTVGGVETQAAIAATGRVPILFVGLAASLDWGFFPRLDAPGGRVSGVDNGYAELAGKRLEWLVRAWPETRRVLVLYQPEVVPTPRALGNLRRAAAILGVALDLFPASRPQAIAGLAERLGARPPDAALLLPSFVWENHLDRVLATLNAAGVPLVGLNREEVARGAALAYGAGNRDLGRQAAGMLARVLAGYPIGRLPVERPDRPRLTLNRRTWARLGRTPAPRVVDLAEAP